MKVKTNDTIHDTDETPIMIIFTEEEKELVGSMSPTALKFTVFPETEKQEKNLWRHNESITNIYS